MLEVDFGAKPFNQLMHTVWIINKKTVTFNYYSFID